MHSSPSRSPSGRERLSRLFPAIGAGSYLALGTIWIWLSDLLGERLFPTVESLTAFQTWKGVAFVLLSGALVYALLSLGSQLMARLPLAEQQLREREDQYRSLVELSPDGILVHEDGRIAYANLGFRRLFGVDHAAPLEGTLLADLVHPEQRDIVEQRLLRMPAAAGIEGPAELRLTDVHGREINVEYASHSDRLGERTVTQTYFRDLASRNAARLGLEAANRELDARVQERTRALEATNRALQMFTHAVAHDLSSPAGRLRGFSDALGSAVRNGDIEKVSHYAARVGANARLMQDIIDGLLALSRAERVDLERIPVDCDALVRELLQDLQAPAGVRIELGVLGSVQSDAAGLRRVWTNLLSNALKYSSHAPEPVVRIAVQDVAKERVFSVTDNGIGFAPEEAERLFDMFSRLPAAQAFPGTGVGLMIVKRIIERQGGRVWASGRPGQGATFCFSLPASSA